MKTEIPEIEATALGGTLTRWAKDTWAWCDHTPAPEVKDMTISWYYNFRICIRPDGQWVEVPVDQAKADPDLTWCVDAGYSTSQSGDDMGERRLSLDSGRVTRLSTREGGKAIREVYLVDVADWDARPPCGARWEKADEPAILAKARELGWQG